VTENPSISGFHQVMCFLAWRQKQHQLPKHHTSLKN